MKVQDERDQMARRRTEEERCRRVEVCAAEVKVNAISREFWVPLTSQEAIVSKRLD
jgi:hypothetical protein